MQKPTVVVVDDHTPTREAYAALLRDCGFRVLEAAHGGEAILLVHRHCPAVVLLDVTMPVLGGLETAACLRAYPPTAHSRILAVTGCTSTAEQSRMKALCDDMLTKPCTPDLLESKVRSLASVTC